MCVAGLEGPVERPRWLRLYPVPFRYLEGERQFCKYDLVEVATRDAGGDKRPESRKINADSIKINVNLKSWASRAIWVERATGPSMCAPQVGVRENLNATSLAAVRPSQVDELEFLAHPGWTKEHLRRFQAYQSQGSSFDEIPSPLLHPPRFRVRLHYRCEDRRCGGHQQTIIDWELSALQAQYRRDTDHALKTAVTRNSPTNPFAAHKEPLLFVGNQEDVRKRAAFTVLGLYYPARRSRASTNSLSSRASSDALARVAIST